MKKKQQKIQIILILIGLLLIFVTYFYYPYMERMKLAKDQPAQQDLEKTHEDNERTFFENVEYKGYYDLNKPFTIKSEKALILNVEPDLVYMEKMRVVLYLSDQRQIIITSDKGRYFKQTYDIYFQENVLVRDGKTEITANNLDLLATTKNIAKIYNNVNLIYSNGSLQAQKIDYDFETKYFTVTAKPSEMVKMKVIK